MATTAPVGLCYCDCHGVVHYYWLVKSDTRWPVFYRTCVALLLAARFISCRRKTHCGHRLLLLLAEIRPETRDTVTLRFQLPGGRQLGAKAGQFLTFDWMVNGKKLPRSYSHLLFSITDGFRPKSLSNNKASSLHF